MMAADQTFASQLIALLPVVAGGMIGVLGGLAGNAFSHHLAQKDRRSLERRSKLEQIATDICETDVWIRKEEGHYLYGEGPNFEHSPVIHVEAMIGLYFPELHHAALDFYGAVQKYRLWLMNCHKGAAEGEKVALSSEQFAEHKGAYTSLAAAREILLAQTREVMVKELPPNNSFKSKTLRGSALFRR